MSGARKGWELRDQTGRGAGMHGSSLVLARDIHTLHILPIRLVDVQIIQMCNHLRPSVLLQI